MHRFRCILGTFLLLAVAARIIESGKIPPNNCFYDGDGKYKLLPGGGRVVNVEKVINQVVCHYREFPKIP